MFRLLKPLRAFPLSSDLHPLLVINAGHLLQPLLIDWIFLLRPFKKEESVCARGCIVCLDCSSVWFPKHSSSGCVSVTLILHIGTHLEHSDNQLFPLQPPGWVSHREDSGAETYSRHHGIMCNFLEHTHFPVRGVSPPGEPSAAPGPDSPLLVASFIQVQLSQ